MSGKLHADGRNAANTAVGFTSKSSGTMPSRYAKNSGVSGSSGSQLSTPSSAARTSATLRPEDAGGGVKLRRHESSKSKGVGDTNRRSFLGLGAVGSWFKHKTESSDSQKQSSQTSVTKTTTATSDSRKKKDGGSHLMTSSLLRSSHLSDSMPSLVVPTVVHPAIVTHRQRDLPESTVVMTTTTNARPPRFPASGAADRTSTAAASRNRWSSYELVGSSISLTVAEEDPAACVDDVSSTDGRADETSKRQSGEHKILLQVNSLPVVRARSAETLIQDDISNGGSTGSLSVSNNEDGNSSTPQRLLGNQNNSGSSRSISGQSTAVQQQTPESQAKRRMLIASLRQTEAKLESTKRLRKKLWASLLNIPFTDYESVGELARQSSHRDGDPRELLLTSLLEADRLTSCVNRLLHLGVGADVTTARTPSISISSSGSGDSSTTSQQQQQPQPQRKTSNAALPDADHVLPDLVDLSAKLHRQLSLLLNAFVETENETRRLTDRVTSVRQQIDDRRTKNAAAPTPSNGDNVDGHVAPPGESQQHDVDKSSATEDRGGPPHDAKEETEMQVYNTDCTDSGPEVEISATDAEENKEATGEDEQKQRDEQVCRPVASSCAADRVEATLETTTTDDESGSVGHVVHDEADGERTPTELEQPAEHNADISADPSGTDAAAADAGSNADDVEERSS